MAKIPKNTKSDSWLYGSRSAFYLFDNARLIHPQLRSLEIHPSVLKHYEEMGCPPEYQIPALQSSDAITNPGLIRLYLAMTPLVVTRIDTNVRRWQVVARVAGFHLSRLHLEASETVAALVIPTPSDSQLDQLITQDLLVNPLLESPMKQQGRIWAFRRYLEKVGALTSVGLAGFSKRTWASWLNCDPRSLREEE